MGQAFDYDGNVLSEVFGETKREVFDKLIQLQPNAHEIRIKSFQDKLAEEEKRLAQNPPATTAPLDIIEPLLQFFEFGHLPPRLQMASRPFCELAHRVAKEFPRNPERTVTLRELLKAKDAAVRTILYK